MPRKSRAALVAPPPLDSIQPAGAASPSRANHTLVGALEHLPHGASAFRGDSEELTPPPPSAEVKEAVIQGIASNILKEARANGTTSSPEAEEPVEEKPKRGAKTTATTKILKEARANGTTSSPEAEESVEAKPKRGAKKATTTTPRKRAAKKAAVVEEDDSPLSEEDVKPTPTPKKRAKKKQDDDGDFETEKVTPKKRTKKVAESEDGDEPKPKKKTPKKSRLAVDEPEFDSEGNEIPKKKRKTKVYPKIEYDIPPVERKETNFKGRLGYACLNTVLRSTKPDSIFCSRTCRIASIEEEGMGLPKGLGMLNVKDLLKMIQWNEDNKIRFMRLSSEMFPFASHEKYGYDLSYVAAELKEAGDLAKKYGHRLTMHPGQFTQLGSPKPGVIKASVRELEYQCEIMDRMGLDQDGVMIIHMGGVYGDKPSTLERFKENYTTKLSDNIKARLVLENDEICYNVDDIMPVCNELNIPIIFDYHHDWINPSCEPPSVLIPKIEEMWKKRGIKMKQHLSEPRPGAESVMERRAHADRCKELPKDLPVDVDLMIEAKDKEQAVFELYRIYGLEDVIHDNLRPPDPNPGMHTKGRKSSLKKKTKETGEVDSDGEPIKLEDVEKEGDGGIGDEGGISPREVKDELKEEIKKETPKKRGRKPKAVNAEEEVKQEPAEQAEEEAMVAEGSLEGAVQPIAKTAAKRGRKPAKAVLATD